MALDVLNPLRSSAPSRQPYEYQLPVYDPLVEAQGGYGPTTVTRPNTDLLRRLQFDPLGDAAFRAFAASDASRRFAEVTRGLPHHQVSLMRQSLLPSLLLGALGSRDVQDRYQVGRLRAGDPLARDYFSVEERIPGSGNQRRALDLLQQQAAGGRPRAALGEGLETRSDIGPYGTRGGG